MTDLRPGDRLLAWLSPDMYDHARAVARETAQQGGTARDVADAVLGAVALRLNAVKQEGGS